jgi:branched-chain amino acid transport system ATP-binding protein
MLTLKDVHAFYGKSHVLHGVHFDVRPARSSPAGPQRLGPLDHRQDHHGPGGRHGLGALEGQQILGRKAFEIAHRASATCPRTATSFPR